jgi:hypothetical protein
VCGGGIFQQLFQKSGRPKVVEFLIGTSFLCNFHKGRKAFPMVACKNVKLDSAVCKFSPFQQNGKGIHVQNGNKNYFNKEQRTLSDI